MIRVVHPGSILTFYPSRIQGSIRHRIPDPDPQTLVSVHIAHVFSIFSSVLAHALYTVLIEPLYLGYDVDTILNSIKIPLQYI